MDRLYTIPEKQRIYAIGDIHGHADTLDAMHRAIDADIDSNPPGEAVIVYLGDYVDRGPDSKGVIDRLIERQRSMRHARQIFLKGNHENGMLEFMKDPLGPRRDWLPWGAVEAMASYGIAINPAFDLDAQASDLCAALIDAVPQAHVNFLQSLTLFHEAGEYLFVHAGIRRGIPLARQTPQDLTFIRHGFLDDDNPHPWRVVHGHTITQDYKPDIRPNRINVDTGHYEGGPLTAAVIEGADVRFIDIRARG